MKKRKKEKDKDKNLFSKNYTFLKIAVNKYII